MESILSVTRKYLTDSEKEEEELSTGFVRGMIIFLMVFVAGMSLFIFSRQSLRLDEAQSLWQTGHSLGRMIEIIALDVHAPFYHLMLHFWQFLFGNGVVAARMLSLIFFLAIIPALYQLGSYAFKSRAVGVYASILIAISPFLNWYGNEIRMYSLFTLIIILNQYFYLRIYRGEATSRTWIAYAVTVCFGLFTHYFFSFHLVTQILFFIAFRDNFPRKSFRNFILSALIAITVFSPWIMYVTSLGFASNSRPLLSPPSSINIFNAFSQFLFGFQDDRLNALLISLWPITVLLAFLALRDNKKVVPEALYFLMSVILPILLIFLVSSTIYPIFLTRYLIFTLPSLYLFLSWVFAAYPRGLSHALRGALIFAMVFTLAIQTLSASTPVKENYREAALYLTENVGIEDAVILSAPFTVYPVEYYYDGAAPLQTLPIWDRHKKAGIPPFDEAAFPGQVQRITEKNKSVWLLLSYDQGYEEKIRLYFDTHFHREFVKTFSPRLTLYQYKLRYDEEYLPKINTQ